MGNVNYRQLTLSIHPLPLDTWKMKLERGPKSDLEYSREFAEQYGHKQI